MLFAGSSVDFGYTDGFFGLQDCLDLVTMNILRRLPLRIAEVLFAYGTSNSCFLS